MNTSKINLEILTAVILSAVLPSEAALAAQLAELTFNSSRMLAGGIWAERCFCGTDPSYWLIGSSSSGYEQHEYADTAAKHLRQLAFQSELKIALENPAQYLRDALDL